MILGSMLSRFVISLGKVRSRMCVVFAMWLRSVGIWLVCCFFTAAVET